MNSNSFDQKIKEVLDKAEYKPSEASWQKFQKALEASRKTGAILPTRRPMFVLLKRTAAAAAFIGAFSVSAYYLFNKAEESPSPSPKSQMATSTKLEGNEELSLKKESPSEAKTQEIKFPNPLASVSGLPSSNYGDMDKNASISQVNKSGQGAAELYNKGLLLPVFADNSFSEIAFISSESQIGQSLASVEELKPVAISNYAERQSRKGLMESVSSVYVADWTDGMDDFSSSYEDPFVYAITAKFGLPTVGAYNAGLGIKLRKDLGKQFFFDAGLEISATDVQLDKALFYRANENGTLTNLGSSADNKGFGGLSRPNGETTNKYSNTVMDISFAPMVGVKLKKIATLALGVDMSRNFNNSLVLRKNSFVDESRLKQTISPTKWVTMWDAGLRAQVAVNINERLSAVAQYRKGMVNYMMDFGGKTVKNSSAQVGLAYNLNP